MASTLFRTLIPGVAIVAAGTVLAFGLTEGPLATDLESRSVAALSDGQFGWAHISIDGRDAVISGVATTQQTIDDAVTRVAEVRGVRAVRSNTVLAEVVSPFPFGATIAGDKLALTGGYPSETAHAELVADAPGATDSTRLLSGGPDSAAFTAAAKFGLDALKQLDQGEVKLADLSLSIEGRARTPEAYDALTNLPAKVPAGIQLAALKVTPAFASPYVWTAHFDGRTIAVTGNTPSQDLVPRLREATPNGITLSTSLTLASGEPSGFESNILTLFKTLLLLESGDLTVSDGTIALTGAPETPAIAERVTATVAALGGTATLAPPRVADFTLRADKQGNQLIFHGYVPDAPTRARLAATPNANLDGVQLGRGAPADFDKGVDFGLAALEHLAEGSFSLNATHLDIAGRAGTVADFKTVAAFLAGGAPQGFSLAAIDVHPPVASPFTFSAAKGDDGRTTLTGFVPDEGVRADLHNAIEAGATDTADPADGAPADFATSAVRGLNVLGLLSSGTLTFDGSRWSLDGFASDTVKGYAADAAIAKAGLREAGWSLTISLPKAQEAGPLPIIAPYVWRASKGADGGVSFTGFAPAEAFQRVARNRAAGVTDSTTLGAGAPSDFATSALAGLDALLALDEGSLGLAGTHWTLTGTTGNLATRKAIQDALSAKIDAANWQIAIQAKDAAPVVTPYLWAADKASDGSTILSGYVPSDDLKTAVTAHAGQVSRDDSSIASGEPAGFSDDLLAGLDALAHLTEGKAQFDGSKWILTGTAPTPEEGQAARTALLKGSKGGAMWTSAINELEPVPSSSSEPVAAEPSSESSSSSSSMPSAEGSSASEVAPASEDASAVSSSASEASSAPSSATESAAPTSSSLEPSAPSSSVAAAGEASSSSQFPETPFMEPKPEPSSSDLASSITSSSEAAMESSSSQAPGPTAIVVTPPLPANFVFEASRPHNGVIALKGAVPAKAAADYFGSIAGGVPTDGLLVTPGMPMEFITDALGGIDALRKLTEGRLGFDGAGWWLRGKAENAGVKDGIETAIAALPGGAKWSVGLDLLAPIDICSDKVSAVAARNAILFKSGSATLTPESMPVLDEVAGDLTVCPKTYVHVEGHTDSDGDADANLALSVARAEAVVAELVKRGVGEERLYAEGYGESVPVASNETKAGKQQNRRIAFTISPE